MSEYYRSTKKLAATMSVVILLAVAFAPAFMEEETDDSDAFVPLIVAAPYLIDLGIFAAAGVGAAIGAYLSAEHGSSDVEEYSAEVSITELTNYLNELIEVSKPYMAVSSDLLAKTQMAFSRESEVAAAHYWGPEKSFTDYSDSIIAYAGVEDNLSNYYRSIESVFDTFTDLMSSWPSKTIDRGYTGISWSLHVGDSSYPVSSSFTLDFGTLAKPSGSSNRMYLATQGSDSTASMSSLTVISTASFVSDSGHRYDLSPGTYQLNDFESGYYTLLSGELFGPFLPTGRNSADLSAGMRIAADGSNIGFVTATEDGLSWTASGSASAISDLGVSGSYQSFSKFASLSDYMMSWDETFDGITSILNNAASSAEAEWMLFDSVGSANPQASLVAYYPDLENLQLTAEQKYVIGALSLVQNANWYANNDDAIQAKDLHISTESLQLKAVGTIRDSDGTILADSVLFTPFVWLRDVMLYEGHSVTLDQPAMAMVWSGENGLADMQLITLTSGMTLDISYLMYNDVEVPSVPLEVKQIDLALADYSTIDPDPVPVPTQKDDHLAKIILIILVILGIVLLLTGFKNLNPLLILLGVVSILIGYYYSGPIGDAIQGISDWFGHLHLWWYQ